MTRPLPPGVLILVEHHEQWIRSAAKKGQPLKLSHVDWHDLDFAERILSSAWLYAANLERANLQKSALICAYRQDASLVQAALDEVLLVKADLTDESPIDAGQPPGMHDRENSSGWSRLAAGRFDESGSQQG